MPEPDRRYNDADGIAWHVRELRSAHGSPALYFDSAMAFRRVAEYPSNWHDLSPDELEVLSHGR